jgi:hypothetical protein
MNLHNRIRSLEEAARRQPAEATVFRLTDEQRASALANVAKEMAERWGVTPEEAAARLRQRVREVYGEPSNPPEAP